MKGKRGAKKIGQKPAVAAKTRTRPRAEEGDDHLGATEEQIGDRTGSGAGYAQTDRLKKPPKGGVIT